MDSFDSLRLQGTFNGLNTPADRARFAGMVMDYMAYIRSRPDSRPGWDDKQGKDDAMKFVRLINNKRGWPLARQFVPEFQEAISDDVAGQSDLMRYILRCIKDRTIPPKLEVAEPQQAEEDLVWGRTVHSVEYLAYLGDHASSADPARREEVGQCLSTLHDTRDLVQSHAESLAAPKIPPLGLTTDEGIATATSNVGDHGTGSGPIGQASPPAAAPTVRKQANEQPRKIRRKMKKSEKSH